MSENGNGTSRLIFWILGLFASIILGGGGFWLGALQSKVDGHSTVLAGRGERIAILETTVHSTLPRLDKRLESIDLKLEHIQEAHIKIQQTIRK